MLEEKSHPRPEVAQRRLLSLDAYRGLIMVTLAFVGFGLAETAKNRLKRDPDSQVWQQVRYQFSHAEWVGCSYWDLIQPSFMFMVGVSMVYSYGKRQQAGDSYGSTFLHALTRSIGLILLSIVLMSMWDDQTNWTFMNVLAQIGLGYVFLFLLWNRGAGMQRLAAVLLLGGTWIAYETYPHAGIDLATGAPEVGVTKEWAEEHLAGVREPWHKNANVGHAVDLVVLNQFPQPEPVDYNKGGYQTINFIPSLATMLFGLMCGQLLRSDRSNGRKLLILIGAGFAGLAAGYVLNHVGACPLVKRIWTPGWTLFSTGWCCLILAGFFGVIDVIGWQRWAFPLVVVGMNSIAMYCMSMTLKPWTARQLQTHFGQDVFTLFWIEIDPSYVPTVQATLVGLVFWLVCYYLYRNKLFFRI